jgi:hypothetical protein
MMNPPLKYLVEISRKRRGRIKDINHEECDGPNKSRK